MTSRILHALALTGLTLAGCGGGDDGGGDDGALPDLAAEACEHLADGPFEDVVAATDPAMAPSVTFAHTAVRIALADFEGGKGGYVKYEAAAAGEYTFFLSAGTPLEATAADGTPVPVVSPADLATCAEVAGRVSARLEVGVVTLRIGPADVGTLGLVAEPTADADHDHEHE